MRRLFRAATIAALVMASFPSGCKPTRPHPLNGLPTVRMQIGKQPFELWIARTLDEQARGLMGITEAQLAPLPDGTERGMLFVFDHSVRDSFWMKNTIIPLDIAYLTAEGTVVTTYTMAPLDARNHQYPPAGPYRYALEVRANRFSELGVARGTVLKIPISALKDAP